MFGEPAHAVVAITATQRGGVTILTAAGSIDLLTVQHLTNALEDA